MSDFAFHPVNEDFNTVARRLAAGLLGLGHSIRVDALIKPLVFWFGGAPWLYFRAMREEGPLPQWHLIRLGDKSEAMIQRQDMLTMQASRIGALAALLDEMDVTRTFPQEVLITDSRIEFSTAKGGLIASIEPIEVQPAELSARHRVDELLKGLKSGEIGRMAHRLQSLPGIRFAEQGAPLDGSWDHAGEVLGLTPDNLSGLLRSMLKAELQIEIKLHQAQALLAAMAGMGSWQEMVAKRDVAWSRLMPTALIRQDENAPIEQAQIALYATPSEAVGAFARALASEPRPVKLRTNTSELAGGGYYLTLNAADPTEDPDEYSWPWLTCGRLPFLYSEASYERLASTYLADPARTRERLLEHFAVHAPILAKHRQANRRVGIQARDERWLPPWFIYRDRIGGEQALGFERIEDGVLVRRHWAKVHKSEFFMDKASGKIHLITEYGKKDLGVLDGLNESHLPELEKLLQVTHWSTEKPAKDWE